ncbi:hypothetical protein SAMN02910275_01737 [Butyrivibrio sp. INlla18]|uniref:hypothetical protein n=1 Tax=Butyrivibrio sp. INlla18 TaxID=1520806 RepID=UPI00088CCB38|nr:hypothetical protein [Butyrivibrio sp. INlla18]SDA62980.1 hypothetical protein SAMN02910275_01737 [Butyrivibrio sp. INlla18]
MGSTYTKAQKEATQRYVNSTDQIRVRTDKGNLDFIKAHAETMGETMGEFVNRAISEAIYRDRGEILIETTHSDEYDISGRLLLSGDNHYEMDYIIDGVRKIKKLDDQKDVPSGFVSDYAWMSLENEYENELLGGD